MGKPRREQQWDNHVTVPRCSAPLCDSYAPTALPERLHCGCRVNTADDSSPLTPCVATSHAERNAGGRALNVPLQTDWLLLSSWHPPREKRPHGERPEEQTCSRPTAAPADPRTHEHGINDLGVIPCLAYSSPHLTRATALKDAGIRRQGWGI